MIAKHERREWIFTAACILDEAHIVEELVVCDGLWHLLLLGVDFELGELVLAA